MMMKHPSVHLNDHLGQGIDDDDDDDEASVSSPQ